MVCRVIDFGLHRKVARPSAILKVAYAIEVVMIHSCDWIRYNIELVL
jgi:hypothetical protein